MVPGWGRSHAREHKWGTAHVVTELGTPLASMLDSECLGSKEEGSAHVGTPNRDPIGITAGEEEAHLRTAVLWTPPLWPLHARKSVTWRQVNVSCIPALKCHCPDRRCCTIVGRWLVPARVAAPCRHQNGGRKRNVLQNVRHLRNGQASGTRAPRRGPRATRNAPLAFCSAAVFARRTEARPPPTDKPDILLSRTSQILLPMRP